MEKYIFTVIAALCLFTAQAQTEGYLIYKEYDSNSWDTLIAYQQRLFDINDDGRSDIKYYTFEGASGSYTLASEMYAIDGWKACSYRTKPLNCPNVFYNLTIPLNDTSLVWMGQCYPTQYPDLPFSFMLGLRYSEGEDYYYGWAEFEENRIGESKALLRVSKTCFCTIPNYPLLWGQTSLSVNNEENATYAFATIHPNPTTGLITINGKDLKAAEVVNTLGQRVATVQGKGQMLQIDIANLPEGIYFVRITDEQGRKCVRKVVKE